MQIKHNFSTCGIILRRSDFTIIVFEDTLSKTPSTLHRVQTTDTVVPDTATVHTTTPKTISENRSFQKRFPEWSDLKTILFENAVFLV